MSATLAVDAFAARLTEALHGQLGPRLQGVVLFGSCARGDARAGSDIDVLVVVDVRDRTAESGISAALRMLRDSPESAAVAAADLEPTPSLLTLGADGLAAHPWILLDVATDGRVLFDPGGRVDQHLQVVRDRMRAWGSRRIQLPDHTWYWDVKPGMRPGEELAL